MTCNDIVYCPNHLYSNVLDTKLYTCVLIQVADEYRYTFLRNDVIYLGLPSYKKKKEYYEKKKASLETKVISGLTSKISLKFDTKLFFLTKAIDLCRLRWI